MLNMIKAEIYKYSKRPFTYITVLSFCIGTVVASPLLANRFPEYTREKILMMSSSYFPIVLFLMMIFCGVISEEYKEGTFKNLCTSNISKSKIFLSKFMIQIILAVIIAFICMTAFLLSLNFIRAGEGYSSKSVINFVFRFLTAIPIYLGGIAIVNLLIVITKKDGITCILYYLLMQLGGVFWILNQRGFKIFGVISQFLLSMQFGIIGNPGATTPELMKAMMIGLIYTLVFTTIATFIFNKQEIK